MIARLRLRRGPDIRRVYSSRKAGRGKLLAVHWRPNQLQHPRIAFTVSTRVGGSVERNLVRRRLREITRPLLAASARPLDIVVVARPGAAEATFGQLEAEFRELSAQVLGL